MQPEKSRAESTVHLASTRAPASSDVNKEPVFTVSQASVRYGGKLALDGVDMTIYKNQITAFIGPSGCGKSTYIRCFNRMNDLIPGAEVRETSVTTVRTSMEPAWIRCRCAA